MTTPRAEEMEAGAVLGIDVGFSERRKSTCLCLLEWDAERAFLAFKKVGTNEKVRTDAVRAVLVRTKHLACVAVDGPLTKGLRLVPHYRAADALLSQGVFQKRGKPGQTSSPIGQKLHLHATQLAELVLAECRRGSLSISRSTHLEAVDELAIVEAFPNQFLAALIAEDDLPKLQRDASDRYWEQLAESHGLDRLLDTLLPGRRFAQSVSDVCHHDERAAATCALTALTVATCLAVGVGNPDDGDIFLPPSQLWGLASSGAGAWMETALRDAVLALRTAGHANRSHARARLHRSYWI